MNPGNPVLEGLRFLGVMSSIFDAFFCAHHRCDDR
ncbi:MAG: hypothetical protein ACOYKH_09825 [Brevefilum fermentans]|nr:hypothetical protein [Chloroflexota bacterium]